MQFGGWKSLAVNPMFSAMSQKLLHAIAPGTRLRIVNVLKRTQGLTVTELAGALGMSYMGVKDVCVELDRRGLLATWREPRPGSTTGRPRMLYRLTERAHDLFPAASNPLTLEILDASKKLLGPAAPEKLLLLVWQQKAADFSQRICGESLAGRVESLAKLRDDEGHMAVVEKGTRIIENHCPFLDVLRAYPLVGKLEADLFTRLLGAPFCRTETNAAGLYRAEFTPI